MSKLTDKPELMAWRPVVMFSASLLCLSITLNNIGFKGVVDAWAASIVANIENKRCDVPVLDLTQTKLNTEAIERLMVDSHKPQGE